MAFESELNTDDEWATYPRPVHVVQFLWNIPGSPGVPLGYDLFDAFRVC